MYASFSGRVHCCCPAHIASAFVRLRRNAAADHWVGRMAERVHNARVDVPLELYERWAAKRIGVCEVPSGNDNKE